jgi:hypothetical protein
MTSAHPLLFPNVFPKFRHVFKNIFILPQNRLSFKKKAHIPFGDLPIRGEGSNA